jgi:hypothetical protein
LLTLGSGHDSGLPVSPSFIGFWYGNVAADADTDGQQQTTTAATNGANRQSLPMPRQS